VLEGNSGISKNKGTSLQNFHPNTELEKFRNCTSIVSGAVDLDARSVWQTSDGHRSPVYHTDRHGRWALLARVLSVVAETLVNFDARNHISRTAEARVAQFCTQVEYIKC